LRGWREKRKPRRHRMTVEVRLRVQSGDISRESEARVEYADFDSMITCSTEEEANHIAEARVAEVIRGLQTWKNPADIKPK
jgi:hypothetical protein